ncbi:MAG: I78 family peptidase inhibitor [Alphaproteobacteria bacterium]
MSVRNWAGLAGALALAACSTAQPAPVDGGSPNGTCDPSNIQQFVGRERSPALEEEMRRVSGAAIVRWVPHGTMITMEYRADRLTVFLDQNNRVERLSCS